MTTRTLLRRALVSAALAGGTIGGAVVALDAAPAHALETPQHYQLTPRERRYACGSFIGTIVFSDGTSLDCYTGVATLY